MPYPLPLSYWEFCVCRTLQRLDEYSYDKSFYREDDIMGSLNFQYKNGGNVPEGVGLLISILVRYPEVCSVRYHQQEHALKFRFVLLKSEGGERLTGKIREALEVFHRLEGNTMQLCEVEQKPEDRLSLLTITRDVTSMSQIEVGLIVDLVKAGLSKQLIYDKSDLPEDELTFQEEVIGEILQSFKEHGLDKGFIAVREEGRVLVYRN
jgi:hypothetical protein